MEETCKGANLGRTTGYAALTGKALPSWETVQSLVTFWGESDELWLERYRQAERATAERTRVAGEVQDQPLRKPPPSRGRFSSPLAPPPDWAAPSYTLPGLREILQAEEYSAEADSQFLAHLQHWRHHLVNPPSLSEISGGAGRLGVHGVYSVLGNHYHAAPDVKLRARLAVVDGLKAASAEDPGCPTDEFIDTCIWWAEMAKSSVESAAAMRK